MVIHYKVSHLKLYTMKTKAIPYIISSLFLAPSLSAQSLLGSFSSLGPAQAESSEVLSAAALQPFAAADEEANLVYGFAEQTRVVQEAAVLEALALDRSEATLTEGESLALLVSFFPADYPNQKVSWTSSAPGVATVENGLVKAGQAGEAVISAVSAAGTASASCRISVETNGEPAPEPIPVTDVVLNEHELTLAPGETFRLKAEVFPSYADNKRVDWESDDVSIATVEKGSVTAVAEGETIIRVTTHDGDFTDECRIRVATIPTGVEEVTDRPKVYPTAVETTLFVELKQPETIYLVSMTGQVYLAKDMQPGINRIDMSNCPAGLYLVKTEDETVKVLKK